MLFISLLATVFGGGVVDFDSELLEVIKQNDFVLTSFYAPWCGHCKALKPTWAELGDKLAEVGVIIGQVDCTIHAELASRFGIKGFPTIKFFRKGRPIDYEGMRDAGSILEWVKNASGPPISQSSRQVDDLKAINAEPIFVYNGPGGTDLFKKFAFLAEEYLPNVHFIKNKSIIEEESVAVIKDEGIFPFSGGDLSEFVATEKFSSFPSITGKYARGQVESGNYFATVVANDSKDKAFQLVRKIALDRNRNMANMYFSHATGTGFLRIMNHMTYRKDVTSGELIILPPGAISGHYYRFVIDDDTTVDDVLDYLGDVTSGREELLGQSAFMRVVTDMTDAFVTLFQKSPVMGGMIIGLPTILITFVIWGVCSVPEVDDEAVYDDEMDEDAEESPSSDDEQRESDDEASDDCQKVKNIDPVKEDDGNVRKRVTAIVD